MEKGGIETEMMRKIEIETVGFTVAEVCRTALEFAGGRKWLQFDDLDIKNRSRKAALKIVQACMISRHENGIDFLFSEMQALSDSGPI